MQEWPKPQVINQDAVSDVILLCDHASNYVPEGLNKLGLDDEALADHIAWDIGAAQIATFMAKMMNVSAILAPVSRLVIDTNRDLGHAGLVPAVSDDVMVPGNRGLSSEDIQARIDNFYTPFHEAAAGVVQNHLKAGKRPFVVGIHSFTRYMNGGSRPWHIGLMWNRDERLAQALLGVVERETDLKVGQNEPYSGKHLYHSLNVHGEDLGLATVNVEIRNDLARKASHQEEWAVLLANSLDELMGRDDLMKRSA